MGDLQPCVSPNPNGDIFGEDRLCTLPSSPPLPVSNPDPESIAAESWAIAEATTQEIVSWIQPTLVADQKRKNVIDYVQRLLGYCIGCEVFPYGSVPLKTYLPDGDIDLTVFRSPKIEDALVSDVHAALRGEEHNEAAPYKVKDVHCIDAEVKLVKCIVQNIVVDISFNQLGGLSTLCFLEQVDQLAGKDHLFKRSIILIKAWCYYESRILGAHHGLISTYALETLVLYIFHLYNSSLNGPLVVLYRFLDYFSKFDWDNYCVSLNGPICKSSLTSVVADLPKNKRDDLLLSQEFLKNCLDMFSVPSSGLETNLRAFPLKHLNIIDPLKETNNLGRSVNRGNFYRIRSAFKYGARKLGWILLLPGEKIEDELKKFFANTLDRHGSNCWTDLQKSAIASDVGVSEHLPPPSQSETLSEEKNLIVGRKIQVTEATSGLRQKPDSHVSKSVFSLVVPEFGCSLDGDVNGVTSGILGARKTNGSTELPVNNHLRTTVSISSDHSHQICSSDSCGEKGKIENLHFVEGVAPNSAIDGMHFTSKLEDKRKHLSASNLASSCSNGLDIGSAVLSDVTNVSEFTDHVESHIASISGSSKGSKFLLDLNGDYESHFRNLQYGQFCHGYAISAPVLLSPPLSPQLPNKSSWGTIHKSLQFPQNFNSESNRNVVGLGPSQFYPGNHCSLPFVVFGEENKKPQGTGTYIPNASSRPIRDRALPGRGRNQAPASHAQLQRHTRNNGSSTAPQELTSSAECRNELSQAEYPVLSNGKSVSSDYHQSQLAMGESFHPNAYAHPSEKLEHASLCSQTWPSYLLEGVHRPESGTSNAWESALSPVAVEVQSFEPLLVVDRERWVDKQSYHLKNEDDFPPLSI
ncbi:hypothetical protein FEM48_Zijuj02G0115000 [Ziziphus jujuba var. spinosa]|uniref:Polymerase nucleotidyl transferase domain-containing protein n=1 Tax=Ziziphus jujuba var. spinosa TaxID=714518 RepID=A0A978VVH0_ZIZJJ|nr:hypothetical protein FEM48_Zijuj02G0115000 [Ziziphus jujuba var. spinosa]